jgi:hypothetical protein
MVGRKPHLTFITQLKTTNMNFEITTLAETMSATEFVIELDNRGISWDFDECDNVLDYNEGTCNIMIDDMAYLFSDGELLDVSVSAI